MPPTKRVKSRMSSRENFAGQKVPKSSSYEKPIIIDILSGDELEEGELTGNEEKHGNKNKSVSSISDVSLEYTDDDAEEYSDKDSFDWCDLNTAMVGDERVIYLNWEEWKSFPSQDLFHKPESDINTLCMEADNILVKGYDILIMMGIHYDFAYLEKKRDRKLLKLRYSLSTSYRLKILKTIRSYHERWRVKYPDTYVIWTLPYTPDFVSFNGTISSDVKRSIESWDDEMMSKDYFEKTQKLLEDWQEQIPYIPVLPLNEVMFMGREPDLKNFCNAGAPKYPDGFLKDGLYCSKMMAMYTAILIIDYFLDNGVYVSKSTGLNRLAAEEYFAKMYPNAENNIVPYEVRKPKLRKRRHHRDERRSSSKHKRSSRSKERRSKSSSRPKKRHKHHHHHHHRHRDRDSSSNNGRTSAAGNDTNSLKSIASLEKEKIEVPSVIKINPADFLSTKISYENKKSKLVNDEVRFWSSLRCLKEVHEIECAHYRKNPKLFPQYDGEKRQFVHQLSLTTKSEEREDQWNKFWKTRMEVLMKNEWEKKKGQLSIDSGRSESSISNMKYNEGKDVMGVDNDNEDDEPLLTIEETEGDDRQKFRTENLETITSYLEELVNDDDDNENTVDGAKKDDPVKENEKILNENKSKSKSSENDQTPQTIEPRPSSIDNESSKSNLNDIISPESPTSSHSSNSDANSDSEYSDSDNSIDLDKLMGNTDFLEGLEEIDKEIKEDLPIKNDENRGIVKDCVSNSMTRLSDSVKQNENIENKLPDEHLDNVDEHSLLKRSGDVSCCKQPIPRCELQSVLLMLYRLANSKAKHLGPLGLSISALYYSSMKELQSKPILNHETKSLLSLVATKLKSLLKGDLSVLHRSIFSEVHQRLRVLLNKVEEREEENTGVNISDIASATVGLSVTEVVEYIKKALVKCNSEEDVQAIYMSVKAMQLDMVDNT